LKEVSIPYRNDKNILETLAEDMISIVSIPYRDDKNFAEQKMLLRQYIGSLFQSLIGTIKTCMMLHFSILIEKVSIPYRDDKNLSKKKENIERNAGFNPL